MSVNIQCSVQLRFVLFCPQMGRITCPLLLVVGQDDQNWAAVESADDVSYVMFAYGKHHASYMQFKKPLKCNGKM